MNIENISIQDKIEKEQGLVRNDEQLSTATKLMFEILILVITLIANRLNLNITNSKSRYPAIQTVKTRPEKKR